MADQNFSIHSGDTIPLSFAIKTSAGVAVDVSTATSVTWKLADSPYGTVILAKTLADGITVSTSTVTVTLTAANTASLEGIYYHELEIIMGGVTCTVAAGQVVIERDLIT